MPAGLLYIGGRALKHNDYDDDDDDLQGEMPR